MRISVFALLALVAVGCQPPPQADVAPERTLAEVEADFEALRAEWQSLANADDAAGVAAFYTEDAVFVDTYGNVYSGREAIQAYFEGSFPTGSDLAIETAETVVEGDMAVGRGTFSQTVQGPEGELRLNGMWMTASIYQADGSVKIRMHQSMQPAEPPPSM
jgi:uncharacterized protein (TIGR02246 family)